MVKVSLTTALALRQPWFDCSCCPTNIVRLLPSLPGYVYAVQNDAVYVNLYIAGKSAFEVNGVSLALEQKNNYPWDGTIKLVVSPEKQAAFALMLRIPGWALGHPVPSDLYQYAAKPSDNITLTVNDKEIPLEMNDKGYVCLQRAWGRGDTVTLNLPMPVNAVVANEAVADDNNRIAF